MNRVNFALLCTAAVSVTASVAAVAASVSDVHQLQPYLATEYTDSVMDRHGAATANTSLLLDQLLNGKVLTETETNQLSHEIAYYRMLASEASVVAYDDEHSMVDDQIVESDYDSHAAEAEDGHGDAHGDAHDDHAFGFHIEFPDLFRTILYFACIYIFGQFASRLLKMPALVGEIFCGIILGPPLLNIVPNAAALVLIGEVGLILLVIEAGIDIDLAVMKLVGSRGLLIAIVGSFLPIGVGFLLAVIMQVGDMKTMIAAGAVFGPTSLGIALNVLKGGGVLNTPVGQMIIAAAVIDDMIALVVLSQLKALTGTLTVASVLIPIVSAIGFLCGGGFICIFILPKLINKFILPRFNDTNHAKIEMVIMFGLVLALMPATYYCQSSYLMGAFLAGLTFCSSDGLHHLFVRQFKRLLQWLMRVFFASTIGFQVPIRDFVKLKIIWQGLVFCLAWVIGKISVGFMVPNFGPNKRFTGNHFRDCMITGFSMAAEGEFAFVIAVFAVGQGLVGEDLYASLILAVLISTIIPPFMLRFTITHYNKKGEADVQRLAEEVLMNGFEKGDDDLIESIRNKSEVFLVIQTQSESSWGLLMKIMNVVGSVGLDVIDHRAWSPRGINTTLVNEVYAKCPLVCNEHESPARALNVLIGDITMKLQGVIDQENSKVKVQRWFPGVIKEVTEDGDGKVENIRERLLEEAHQNLETRQSRQLAATKQKSVRAILKAHGGMDDAQSSDDSKEETHETISQDLESGGAKPSAATRAANRRRSLKKTYSTPVIGGGLFGEQITTRGGRSGDDLENGQFGKDLNTEANDILDSSGKTSSGVTAQITINHDVFHVQISDNTYRDLKQGANGTKTDSRGVAVSGIEIKATNDAPVTQRLEGFVRTASLARIVESEKH